ncbi:MAG: BlaI/MecI/CopY family transcriptional regulator [Phycisphaeraceae bacterium]|nr:BlaI/MecI/CopY family transcriptional regulator [Phycisphaeraceae bacterium]
MKLTDTEWQIMNCLWERYPATARGISERLPKEVKWAYTTIRTLLSRLVDKGAVREYKQGITSQYEPVLKQEDAQRSAFKTLLNQAFDGAFGPMLHFLVNDQSLTDTQRQALAEALEAQSKKKGDSHD